MLILIFVWIDHKRKELEFDTYQIIIIFPLYLFANSAFIPKCLDFKKKKTNISTQSTDLTKIRW